VVPNTDATGTELALTSGAPNAGAGVDAAAPKTKLLPVAELDAAPKPKGELWKHRQHEGGSKFCYGPRLPERERDIERERERVQLEKP
jgi:hypothetical protein